METSLLISNSRYDIIILPCSSNC